MNYSKIAKRAIEVFIEYRDIHGYNEKDAKERAIFECQEAEFYGESEDREQDESQHSLDCKGIIQKPGEVVVGKGESHRNYVDLGERDEL